jgi:hypothetical protein
MYLCVHIYVLTIKLQSSIIAIAKNEYLCICNRILMAKKRTLGIHGEFSALNVK